MKRIALLSMITANLALSTSTVQQSALDTWAEKWLPTLTERGQALLSGPFDLTEVGSFARDAVTAAQDLKGVFSGSERAGIAQAILHTAIAEFAPPTVRLVILPIVDGPGCAGIIEAAFRVVFGYGQGAPPVVDASDVAAGGIQ